jgi:FkbM family methyltransferase
VSLEDIRFAVRRVRKLLRLVDPARTMMFLFGWVSGKRLLSLKLRQLGAPLLVRRSDSDITVLWAIFGDRECEVSLDRPPRFIVDGGAYVGYSSAFFAERYPDARVVAVEPEPENYELLLRNCRPYPNVQPLRAGLWSSDSALAIHNPGEKSWGFRVSQAAGPAAGTVAGITIPRLLERYGASEIDILKLDIEGAEEALFSGDCSSWLLRVRAIVVETHGEVCAAVVRKAMQAARFHESRKGEKLVFTRASS